MQNIEFKAELRDLEAARTQCAAISAQHVGEIEQTDTYYRLADGRLKHRVTEGQPSEWIFYHRANRVTPRMSNYSILSEAEAQRRWGIDRLRPWLRVTKIREVWTIENVRIHLDQVDKLGCFIEFEAIISSDFDVRTCHEMLAELREAFEPILGEAISMSYSDLMEQELAGDAKR